MSTITRRIDDRNTFSDLALNTVSVLGNFATQVKRVLPKEDSQVLSFVKCLSFISAGNNFNLASKDIKTANRIKDFYGVSLNKVKLARSSAQFVSGILYFSSLGLSGISSLASCKVIIITSKFFSKTTSFLSNSAIILMLLNTCMRLHEQISFQQELAELENRPEVSPEQKAQDIARFLKQQLEVPEKLQQEAKRVLSERYKGNSQKIHRMLSKAISKRIEAKSVYMKRVTNRSCIEHIKNIGGTDSSALIHTVEKTQKVVHENIRFNLFLAGLGCIGLLGLAVSFIPGSAFVTLSTILGLIPTVAFSITGLNDLILSLQNNKEGTYDRLVLIATGCIGIATATALYALTKNPMVKAAAALLALVWISLLYYTSLHLDNQSVKA